jgi:hypothetical protein
LLPVYADATATALHDLAVIPDFWPVRDECFHDSNGARGVRGRPFFSRKAGTTNPERFRSAESSSTREKIDTIFRFSNRSPINSEKSAILVHVTLTAPQRPRQFARATTSFPHLALPFSKSLCQLTRAHGAVAEYQENGTQYNGIGTTISLDRF